MKPKYIAEMIVNAARYASNIITVAGMSRRSLPRTILSTAMNAANPIIKTVDRPRIDCLAEAAGASERLSSLAPQLLQ